MSPVNAGFAPYAVTLAAADSRDAAASEAAPLMHPSPELVISKFIEAETKFRETVKEFSFKRDVVLQTLGADGEVTGEYVRNSVFVIDDQGKRVEQLTYHPKSTIKEMKITKEDLQDLASSQLFGLEAADLNLYHLAYAGEEMIGDRPTYLVRVRPVQEPDPKNMQARFFVGLIWIDKATFQIVRLQGITEPHGKQRFPMFQTSRDLILENLRFPTTTTADDVLHFAHYHVRFRINVRYYDFKRFGSRLNIVEVEN